MGGDVSLITSKGKDWALKIEGPLGVAFSLVIVMCLGYAVTVRGWQFFKLPLTISLIFSIFSFFLSIAAGSKLSMGRRLLSGVRAAAGTILFGTVLFSIILGSIFSLTELWEYASSHIAQTYKSSLLVGLLTFIVGVIFFAVRTFWRVSYGLSEIVAGVSIASYRSFGAENWFSSMNFDLYVVLLTAGVYLVVRGFDNIFQGYKESNDPMVKAGLWLKSQIYVSNLEKVSEMYGDERSN